MKTVALVGAVVAVAMIGCQPKNDTASVSVDVTDVKPVTGSAPAIMYTPAAVAQPITPETPVLASSTASTVSAVSMPATAGQTHTVRRGDTLYSIARSAYGDGKQWQRIALANPGVSPSSLKVGQTIVVP